MCKALFILFYIILLATSATFQPNRLKGRLTKCEQDCKQQVSCLQKCKMQKQQITKIILIVAIVVVVACLGICGICILFTHKKFRKLRLRFYAKYVKIAQQYNQQNRTLMSQKQFEAHAQFIIDSLDQSRESQNFISIDYKGLDKLQKVRVVHIQNLQPFLRKIQLRGWDCQGNWSASGAIVCGKQGVIVWFVKQYDDIVWKFKDNEGRFIYKSDPCNLQSLEGVWFNLQTQTEENSQNSWKIEKIERNLGNGDSNIQIMN